MKQQPLRCGVERETAAWECRPNYAVTTELHDSLSLRRPVGGRSVAVEHIYSACWFLSRSSQLCIKHEFVAAED